MSSSDSESSEASCECSEPKCVQFFYEEFDRPPLGIREELVAAVIQNKVDVVKELLSSSIWDSQYYNTTNKDGYNLLQVAILAENQEVFDYLLSLPEYPIEYETEDYTCITDSITALMLSLVSTYIEHFAYELIKKGARINQTTSEGNPLLHQALGRNFAKVSKLLIEKGVDVNVCNHENLTPLQIAAHLKYDDDYAEIVSMLLIFGADSKIKNHIEFTPFEQSVKSHRPDEIQEVLFYYTYDKFSDLEIHLEILLQLALDNPPLFDQITKRQFDIITNLESASACFRYLSLMDSTRLKTIITRFGTSINFVLTEICKESTSDCTNFRLDNLNLFLENTSLKDQMITFINSLDSSSIVTFIARSTENESVTREYMCYFLSYGLEIVEFDLHFVYFTFRFCQLLKILLQMDFKKENPSRLRYNCMPILLINMNANIQNILEDYDLCSFRLRELVEHFSHPKLYSIYKEKLLDKEKESFNPPQIPRLVELARNVFRSHFVDRFQIKTTRRFYTLLNCLPISSTHIKIITYETKLYSLGE